MECKNVEISSSTFFCFYISCEPQVYEFAKYSVQTTVKIKCHKASKGALKEREADRQSTSNRNWLKEALITGANKFFKNILANFKEIK